MTATKKPVRKAYLDSLGQLVDERGDLILGLLLNAVDGVGRRFESEADAQEFIDCMAEHDMRNPKGAWNVKVDGRFLDRKAG